jgi:hypothetical protein
MNKKESGQALLLILLAMSTVVTITLSVVSRTVSDIAVTTVEEESLRAFSAAEAGVEEALVGDITPGSTIEDVVTGIRTEPGASEYNADVTGFPEVVDEYVYPREVLSGETATVWLMSHDANDILVCGTGNPCFTSRTLRMCWSKGSGSGTTPAVEASLVYEEAGQIRMSKAVYDPSSGRTPGASSPDGTNCTVAGQNFGYRKDISFASLGVSTPTAGVLKMIRFRMLYNDRPQTLAVDGMGTSLPSQGRKIDSTGTSGESTRRVEVYALYPDVPAVFDSALFSRGGAVKP